MDLVLSTREFLLIFLGLFALSFTVVAQESCEVDGCSQPSVGQAMLQKQSARVTHAFDMDQPNGRIVDINIGCNFNPMPAKEGNFLLLVDPLPDVCSSLSQKFKTNTDVAVLCCAISNYTGSATFLRYNTNGQSSSLSSTIKGKTFKFPLDSKDTGDRFGRCWSLRWFDTKTESDRKVKDRYARIRPYHPEEFAATSTDWGTNHSYQVRMFLWHWCRTSTISRSGQ